jgi:hypothetical protein
MDSREKIEVVLKIFIIFLGILLVLSVLNGAVTAYMTIGALSFTYIFIHYWEKRFLAKKKREVNEIKNRS